MVIEHGGLLNTTESAPASRRELLIWRPDEEVAEHLPDGFELRFEIWSDSDSNQRIVPTVSAEYFVLSASLAGLAILNARLKCGPEVQSSYNVMRLIYAKRVNLRERFTRRIRRIRDLSLSRPERPAPDVRDILPLEVGAEGLGWSVLQFVEAGRDFASGEENRNPTDEQIIRYGLLAAAARIPFDCDSISTDESRRILRLALFDYGPADDVPDEDLTERVISRLIDGIERHQDDNATEFQRWFVNAADNLVHAIAKQKKRGGSIDRSMVRQAMIETVFRSYTYVGQCMHVLMGDVRCGLERPLNLYERAMFDSMYRCLDELGGIPFITLYDRFSFLREPVLWLWSAPEEIERRGVLLRYLHLHAELIRNKRESERVYASCGHRETVRLQSAGLEQLNSSEQPNSSEPTNRWEALEVLWGELRERREASCRCGTASSWHAEVVTSESNTDTFEVNDSCAECGHQERFTVSVKAAREMLEEFTTLV